MDNNKCPKDKMGALKWIIENKQCHKINGYLIDYSSASMILQVVNSPALSEHNRDKYMSLSIRRMAMVAWKLTK
jgi:hypothetical protein